MENNATIFEFTSYEFEPEKRRVFFNYKTEFKGKKPFFFTETVILPKIPDKLLPKELTAKLLEGLHIILGISYYKLYCATNVRLNYRLTEKEADFWTIVYRKGLGEFFYKNKLDPKISPKFPFTKTVKTTNYSLPTTNRSLVGIGGGKDSIVAAELLKMGKFDITGLAVQTNKESALVDEIIKKAGVKDLKVKRILDKKVFGRHQYGGHIPISAIYAFLGIFAAVLYEYSYFIVGNEYSSNFGNLKYKGEVINHQWSKSFEFEKLFQDYIKSSISPDIFYFSLLRPFYEIRLVKMFSQLRKYFPLFSSCNKNFSLAKKISGGLWCNECPKCIFVFILLSAFLPKKEIVNIFGRNLYEDKILLPLFKDVLGFGKMKPFDCIGTFEESQTAFNIAGKNYKNDFIVKELLKKTKYSENVFRTQKESFVPEQFKFLGMESALILGYGMEGKASEKYLKKYHAGLKIGIADANQGKNYLERQKDFDIAIKTPGIQKELVKIPYTTATNVFFSKVSGKNKIEFAKANYIIGSLGRNKNKIFIPPSLPIIIGVTGSKGKSTTSSIIYEILKEAGKKVELMGNIGKPMLERLLGPIDEKTIFVLELSSAQLDDLRISPDISVATNLFPEHMDYHGNAENYYQAKKNIINFQSENGCFVYDPKNKIMGEWLKDYRGRAVPFSKIIPVKEKNILLAGEHNKNNIRAAVSVARMLGIKDPAIKKVIKNFKALPHRLEFAGRFKGIDFYDDGSSTNPESCIEAIKSLKNIGTIFLGGEERGYDFSGLEKTIKKYKISNIVLFPDNGDKIIKDKKEFNILKIPRPPKAAGTPAKGLWASAMEEAVSFAYKNTKKGKICLLSGASPSYSLWKNFSEKGDEFKKIVKKLAQ